MILGSPSTEDSQFFRINLSKLSGSIANLDCKASELYFVFSRAEVKIHKPPLEKEDSLVTFNLSFKFMSDVTIVDSFNPTENNTPAQSELEKNNQDQLVIDCKYNEISFSLEDGRCLKYEPQDRLYAAELKSFNLTFNKQKFNVYDQKIKAELKMCGLHFSGKLGLLIKSIDGIIAKLR